MSQLKTLESTFLNAIFDGPTKNRAIKKMAKEIVLKKQLTPEQQIAIYRDSVLGGIVNALAQLYPVCLKLVGEPFFNAMATQFVYQQPLKSPDIGDAGEHFAHFITGFKPAKNIIYLTDVAELEWRWHKAFNATDSDVLNLESLAKLTEEEHERLCFSLAPSASLLASAYPIHLIWQNNQDDSPNESINLDSGNVKLLIWRHQFDMRIDVLNDSQWQFLTALQNPHTFSQICEQLLIQHPKLEIPLLTAQAVKKGWITNYHLKVE